jgi:ADP-heptose:LPS heptosyltransferase
MPSLKHHEIIRRLQLIEKMGAMPHTERLSFFLQPEERVDRSKKKTRVALHPGSKDHFKRWPAEHFIEVGKKLVEHGLEVIITGSQQETALTQKIANCIPGATQLNPTLTLRQFAAELEHFDLLISNDTGPVHLASALNVPVIALYGPTNPTLCGPHKAKQAITLANPISCQPCLKRKCHRPFCLLQIGPEEVIDQALKLL